MNAKNILILYSEVMGYNFAAYNFIINNFKAKIYLIHWDYNKKSGFEIPKNDNILISPRSKFKSASDIIDIYKNITFDIIYCSGWMDKEYLKVCRYFKNQNSAKIVCGIDNQWHCTFKQNVARIAGPILISKYFTHAWVSGIQQFEFARKIGFQTKNIISYLYCADSTFFNSNAEKLRLKKNNYPKKLVFIGRFAKEKGLEILVEAFKSLNENQRNGWTLELVGNGELKSSFENLKNVELTEFLQPHILATKMQTYGAFCLPSLKEPWGVVIHEAVSSGLPVILSDACGAATVFLKNGYNGFLFQKNNVESLKKALVYIFSQNEDELICMSERSLILSNQINHNLWAANLFSIL